MNLGTQLADAMLKVSDCRKAVAAKARALMAELPPFTKPKTEDVLNGDTDRVTNLAMDLAAARAELAEAVAEADALKRRAQ